MYYEISVRTDVRTDEFAVAVILLLSKSLQAAKHFEMYRQFFYRRKM